MRGDGSACSSITSLFLDEGVGQNNHLSPRTPSSYEVGYKSKVYNSASKVLDDYIHNFDKFQTIKLAKSMTEICTQTPIKRDTFGKKEPSTLEKEIKMARLLLPSNYNEFPSCDSSISLATDELLTAKSNCENPSTNNNVHLESAKYREIGTNNRMQTLSGTSGLRIHGSKTSPMRKNLSSVSSSESDPSSTSHSTNSFRFNTRKRKPRLRKALLFSSDEEDASEQLQSSVESGHRLPADRLTSCSSTTNPSSRLSSSANERFDSNVESQIDDVRKTWRLVDDLKADLTSTGSFLDGRPKPPEESLVELIERLSAAAVRKENKLRNDVGHSMNQSTSMRYSDLQPTLRHTSPYIKQNEVDSSSMHAASLPTFNQHSLNGIPYTTYTTKYKDLNLSDNLRPTSSAPASPFKKPDSDKPAMLYRVEYAAPDNGRDDYNSTLTTDNISEVMRMIDERNHHDYFDLQRAGTNASLHHDKPHNRSVNGGKVVTKYVDNTLVDHNTMDAGRTPYISRALHNARSPSTDVILDGDRTWEKLPASRSRHDSDSSSHISLSFHMEGKPTAVRGFMEECLASGEGSKLSGGCQPGSVEALKNMIFTLQGLTNKDTRTEGSILDDVTISDDVAGDESLRRALTHLTNLKNIVQN